MCAATVPLAGARNYTIRIPRYCHSFAATGETWPVALMTWGRLRRMGLLDEPGLDRLVSTGCTACRSKKLTFLTIVDGLLPIMVAEPVGRITWVYDGEKFVDGVYEVRCSD